MELLAPAGHADALYAAVQSGADAVYVGGTKFSARGSANNFSNEELEKWVKYAHIRGVDIHVAANTLIKEKETEKFLEYIGFLNKIGVDAVIMQDLGMAYAVKKLYPGLSIHASTQLTCASAESAKKLEDIGFSRIVLARELTLSEIEKIKKSVSCEIEVFVHGAICMSYSGQCLMSSMIGGRSGNRGYCAQPCRLPYKFTNNGKNVLDGYLLSPKDMCLLEHLENLEKIGVDSLKIEGRLKRAEYVSCVVGVYRRLIDAKCKPQKKDIDELLDAFNRSGFTDGYLTGNLGKNMMAYTNPSNISDNKFSDEVKSRCKSNTELKKIPVTIEAELKIGSPFTVTISDGKNSATARTSVLAELARKSPLQPDRIEQQLKKLGQTPYCAKEVFVLTDENAIIPISEINNVRRMCCELLDELRSKRKPSRVNDFEFSIKTEPVEDVELTASVRTLEQAKSCINSGIKRVYAPFDVINKLDTKDCELIALMPPVDKENRKIPQKGENILINSIGQVGNSELNKISLNYRMNVTNSYTIALFEKAQSITLSPELSINEIKSIKKPCDTEIIVYGRLPLMVFENCPTRSLGKCDKGKSLNILTDRKNEQFPLLCSQGCFCELVNSKPLYMADKIDDLKGTGAKYLRLDFTIENSDECLRIISEYKTALFDGNIKMPKENTFTRGHFYKAIQ